MTAQEIESVKQSIKATGLTVPQLVETAWAGVPVRSGIGQPRRCQWRQNTIVAAKELGGQ